MMFGGLVELVILKGLFKFMFFEFVVLTERFAFDLARGVYHELNITNSTSRTHMLESTSHVVLKGLLKFVMFRGIERPL